MMTKNRILVVDDDPTNINVIQESFQGRFDLRSASSGDEALLIASGFKPDLILLDIMMPGIDGYETCRKIRMNPHLRFTKILMVSAKTMINERLTGYGSGADDYITKPFDDDELMAKVKVYLNLKFIEEFNDFKNNVLKLMSSEIRSPLSSIMGSFGLLMHPGTQPSQIKAQIEQIVSYGNRLLQLCDESMLLCELKEGQGVVKEELMLKGFIDKIIDEYQSKGRIKNISFQVDNKINKAFYSDPVLIKKALCLIIENCLAYSSIGGNIVISTSEELENLLVTISDQGKGITNRFFHEISNSTDNVDRAGEGISIAIAQIALRLNAGSLVYTSNNPSGVSFCFRLPKPKKAVHYL